MSDPVTPTEPTPAPSTPEPTSAASPAPVRKSLLDGLCRPANQQELEAP